MNYRVGNVTSHSITKTNKKQAKIRPIVYFGFCSVVFILLGIQIYLFVMHGLLPAYTIPTSQPYSSRINNVDFKSNDNATATVAYAISLIKCNDHQTNDAGLVDAALVLRHSIHTLSIRSSS